MVEISSCERDFCTNSFCDNFLPFAPTIAGVVGAIAVVMGYVVGGVEMNWGCFSMRGRVGGAARGSLLPLFPFTGRCESVLIEI